ncbi:hypothetical protein CSC70_11790 [Pseudoxanthomonas kalamensis DSM 18571]|uniref:YihY family inner membrane protein n=1 Tax=Pseudoxanthomonas kalamensis TaxID=289483 RepID=UPI0013907985|nr:YihY family inner membrane protein [Pseudoxanthomonas kalamensis]KAF1708789.1 hypothetical protein CSC70_11790 [Pseudoxanthomonas kalamensis DSM 18571]
MEPLDTLNRWSERLRDRERIGTFARFLARRFLDDRLFQAAAALAYTTVFALVPLAMVVLGVLSAFPVFDQWRDQLIEYVFSHFVPGAASAVMNTLIGLSDNIGKLTVAGAVGLIVSLLITLNSVEGAFNRIWRVVGARPQISRFLVYWTVLTLGSLLAAASFAMSVQLFALPLFSTEEGKTLQRIMLGMTPVLIQFVAITAIYRVVPHQHVKWRYATAGALLATILLELIKWGLGAYLGSFNAYQKVYGALAIAPIFLLWTYLCWVTILLGASFASAISAFRYQPLSMRLPVGYEVYGLLRMLGRFEQARVHGRGLHSDEILELEPMLTDSLIEQFLGQLSSIQLVRSTEGEEWLLARDLDDVTLAELYEACQLRLPIAEAVLPQRDDALGQDALQALDRLRMPLRDLLKQRVGDIYTHVREESA